MGDYSPEVKRILQTIDGVSKLFEDEGDEKLAGIIEHISLPNRHGNQTSIAKG